MPDPTPNPGADPTPTTDGDPNAGGEGTQNGTQDQGQQMQAQLAEANAQIEQLRKLQSGETKRVSQLTEQLRVSQERVAELEGSLAEALETIAQRDEQLQVLPELQSQLGELTEAANARSAEAQRAQLVATEFPMLAPLLETGGLPALTDADDFRAKAQKIVTALGITADQQYKRQMEGTKPPATPPAGATVDPDSIYAPMMDALKRGDMEEYRRLSAEWYEHAAPQLVDVEAR
jgi:TolA-binding protein